ncbi:hypothetical protein [Reyranella sp.]|uniref:hypothetical protein n=1 Tax=Reyranella sp. TaxID=1929291 RepID=UPI002F944561
MRFLLHWSIKLAIAGLLYVAVTSVATATLPSVFFGLDVPAKVQPQADGSAGSQALEK